MRGLAPVTIDVSDYGATPAFLESGLSVTSLNMPAATWTDSPAFTSSGARAVTSSATVKDITLGYAVSYSSSFVNMGCGMFDTRTGKQGQCMYYGLSKSHPLPPQLMNFGMHVELKTGTGQASDGGESELLGVIPLLRAKKTSIVMNYVEPDNPATGKMKRLFGLNYIVATNPCSAGQAANSQIGVFPPELWPALSASVSSPNNTGVHVMRNVQVNANPYVGVEAYTLDMLVVIDNGSKTAFEETILDGPETVASLSAAGYPNDPSLKLGITPTVAVAMSLLYQWKVAQNADVLAEALGAA